MCLSNPAGGTTYDPNSVLMLMLAVVDNFREYATAEELEELSEQLTGGQAAFPGELTESAKKHRSV